MSIPRKLTLARLTTIYKRQDNPCWTSEYVPSILATRAEAPSISNAYLVRSAKFGRLIHLLSTGEQSAFLLAAYHPNLVGLQEQRMLSPEPRSHPLLNMLGEVPSGLKPLKGVIDVADRLGCLSRLPKIKAPARRRADIKVDVVFPYVGDLLLAIRDSPGKTRCLNWSIKANEASFKRPISDSVTRATSAPDGILIRHELERTYYADAGIPTHFVASSKFDAHVIHNLRFLYRYQQQNLNVGTDERTEMASWFQSCLETEIPVSELLPKFSRDGQKSVQAAVTCFYQEIWERRLRVDLFRPILIDRPLHPESRDVLDVYAHLFQGGAVCT